MSICMDYTIDQAETEEKISKLLSVVLDLQKKSTILEKQAVLDALPAVQEYLERHTQINSLVQKLDPEKQLVIKSIIAIGQADIVFNGYNNLLKDAKIQILINQLVEIERFYQSLGGIVGYHLTMLSLIRAQQMSSYENSPKNEKYFHPEGLDLETDSVEVRQAVKYGLESLNKVAEMYPVGGAGERLNLIDDKTGIPLPAAELLFLGRTLLEGLIRDLQAKEYLYYKCFGKQIEVPVAMMTSEEKDNEAHIIKICENHHWFGRQKESFFFFKQPLVPTITREGNWSLSAPFTLNLKPGGHGVIWKLAEEKGVFSWLESKGYSKSIIRQINNPIGSTDFALVALMGVGCKEKKSMGFLSCERLLRAAEGVDIVIETKTKDGYEYKLTNIEYTELEHNHIGEVPAAPGSPYSIFPSNTNLLFVDLQAIRDALRVYPIPGQIINMKSKIPFIDENGKMSQIEGGRLESTMQNIADNIVDRYSQQLREGDFEKKLQTFIVYNSRHKTISTAKQSYQPEKGFSSTPEQSYYDIMSNNRDLLEKQCGFIVPQLSSIDEYLEKGPGFIFLYNPALGPFYSIIAQKIRNGRLAQGSELQLEIAEADISNIDIQGCLLIESSSPLGCHNEKGILNFGGESRCVLRDVQVINKGMDYSKKSCFWKNEISRQEAMRIVLGEGSEFHAENVLFEGDLLFEVPAGHRLQVSQDNDGMLIKKFEKITAPTWCWEYAFDADYRIKLTKQE